MTPEPWQNIDTILDVLEKAGCCRDGYVNAPEDVVANALREWLRGEANRMQETAPAKYMECVIEPGHLTDQQVVAGVRALRETRNKFGGNQDDQALVYAVVYAALLAHIPNPPIPKIGELPEFKR